MNLKQVFKRFRDRPWLFVRPLGNWGDELLFAGAERMGDAVGIRWHSVESHEFAATPSSPDHCIYLHGGGGYNSWCSGKAFDNLQIALARPVRQVVQGPVSTAEYSEWLADRFNAVLATINCREWRFYARERLTYSTLSRIGLDERGAVLGLDDDTALSLSTDDILEMAELDAMPKGRYDLAVLREDPEQPELSPPHQSKKMVETDMVTLDPAYAANSFRHWLRIHLCARSIISNRLHSAITGTVAGKPVTIGPGSYHKNRSVWEFSLENREVHWTDSLQHPGRQVWSRLPQRLQDSYKLRQLRLAINRVPLS